MPLQPLLVGRGSRRPEFLTAAASELSLPRGPPQRNTERNRPPPEQTMVALLPGETPRGGNGWLHGP